MKKDQQYLNEVDVARMTSFSIYTLRNWRFVRKGPRFLKIGRSVRYQLDDVLKFMNAVKIETGDFDPKESPGDE